MPNTPTLLTIGDLGSAQTLVSKQGMALGMNVLDTKDLTRAFDLLCTQPIAMTFLSAEFSLPDFFSKYRDAKLSTSVVVVGPSGDGPKAVGAIRLGAIEYLPLPVDEALLKSLLGKISQTVVTQKTTGPVARDQATLAIMDMAQKFANSNATVLVRGESGTGKEVFSQFIHQHSPRVKGPFISVNCAAIPENLLESELFGHEKGAFSGALNRRIGKFEQANGGTLLLDEISEMDLSLQAKLLRAIQERVIDPIGASKPVPVDIRLIATTNRNLEEHVAKGNFREDLYFRLNVVSVDLPPLRERRGDIAPLAQHFANHYSEQNGFKTAELTPTAIKKLEECYWKGNVRELENTIHRAVILASGAKITADHIVISPMSAQMMPQHPEAPVVTQQNQASVQTTRASQIANTYGAAAGMFNTGVKIATPPMIGRTVQDVEKELILSTLNYCGGNRTHAADILGISIRTLRNKLKEYEDGIAQASNG